MDYLCYEHITKDLTDEQFERTALELFRYQAKFNPVYRKYLEYLNRDVSKVSTLKDIPFLPIEFFKTHKVVTKFYQEPKNKFTVFRSSGTTGMERSEHYVYDLAVYDKSLLTSFEIFYSKPQEYTFLALLPSYLERSDSSLVYMVKRLMEHSESEHSGFYLYNYSELYEKLRYLSEQNKKTVLIGVSFALLDFVEQYRLEYPELIVIETGGMKGRKREIVREELHDKICSALRVQRVHSEYGMTELLSQAYAPENGVFFAPPWMKVVIRDMNDPFAYVEKGRSGGINVIDLANVHSCAFIETKDLGRITPEGGFEVLGRFDNSDLRGCNLMVV